MKHTKRAATAAALTNDDVATPAQALRAILSSEVFAKSDPKALRTLALSICAMTATMWLLYVMPWYLLPVGWVLAAVSALGLFAIANDCSHGRFFTSDQLNNIIGTVCFLPILLPLESWRLHHRHDKPTSTMRERAMSPFYWIVDFSRGVVAYFDLSQFDTARLTQARLSVSLVYLFGLTFFSLMLYFGGVWSLVKYWLAPYLVFHWGVRLMRAISPYHYSKARGLTLTYLRLPASLEWLCHSVNFQAAPNALFPNGVPCYNLALARAAIASSSEWRERLSSLDVFEFAVSRYEELKARIAAAVELLAPELPPLAENENVVDDTASSASTKSSKNNVATPAPAATPTPTTALDAIALHCQSLLHFLRTEVNWIHTPLLLGTPLIALYGLLFVTPTLPTLAFAVLYYFVTGVGITGGYHRLFAHRAYDATWPLRTALLCAASGAVEGSARWWCRDHRAHHRYTDTDKDPYTITKGFFYAHIGWMLLKQKPQKIGRADISDLDADVMIRLQHRYYPLFALFFGFLLPTLVCGLLFGDYSGGYFYAGVVRLVFVHHATFCVNSLAHYIGSHTYADNHTPRDHFITALMTLGEGYHNFHHEFPQDYRNAIRWFQYDPTKAFIRLMAFFGLAYNLHRFPENEIHKGALQIAEKQLARRRRLIDWGPSVASIPVMSLDDVANDATRKLMVIDGLVYDFGEFASSHPGGKIIDSLRGKDASSAFGGAVYAHSRAARNLLHTMLVARLPATPTHTSTAESAMAADDLAVLNAQVDERDDHGLLAHVSVARAQLTPIKESAYEIDFAL